MLEKTAICTVRRRKSSIVVRNFPKHKCDKKIQLSFQGYI